MWGLWLVVGLTAWFSVGFSTWHVHQQANADSRLQEYEKKKIGRENKTDKITGATTTGDTVIGDLLERNMILI